MAGRGRRTVRIYLQQLLPAEFSLVSSGIEMVQHSVKLHGSDIMVIGNIRKSCLPYRKRVKRLMNFSPGKFYMKSNNDIVNSITNTCLEVYGLRITRCDSESVDNNNEVCSPTRMTRTDIVNQIKCFCNGVLPVNIFTNNTAMANILNFVITEGLQKKMFHTIPVETCENCKNQPKIKVWSLKLKRSLHFTSLSQMFHFYRDFANGIHRQKNIEFSKKHCYLRANAKDVVTECWVDGEDDISAIVPDECSSMSIYKTLNFDEQSQTGLHFFWNEKFKDVKNFPQNLNFFYETCNNKPI